MNMREAVARWHTCNYGKPDRCRGCRNYMLVDPRTGGERGIGPGTTGQRTLCSLLDDLDYQVRAKTEGSTPEE